MLWSHCRPILAFLDSGHREDVKLNASQLVCTPLLKREVKLIYAHGWVWREWRVHHDVSIL